MPAVLLAASRATTRGHPLWHYLLTPALGVIVFACAAAPDAIKRFTRHRKESLHDDSSA